MGNWVWGLLARGDDAAARDAEAEARRLAIIARNTWKQKQPHGSIKRFGRGLAKALKMEAMLALSRLTRQQLFTLKHSSTWFERHRHKEDQFLPVKLLLRVVGVCLGVPALVDRKLAWADVPPLCDDEW